MKKKLKASLIIPLLLAGLTSFLVFYKLDSQSLHPWDEAWYATIGRNLVRSGDVFNLQYNQGLYWDHPPIGFYLMALSQLVLGFTEVAARIPQALLGVASVVLIYLAGKKLKNNWVGLAAALILVSSRWFLFRARTGNLDILLIFSQLLFFYTALTTREHQRLQLAAFTFGLTIMTKSAISITLAPLLILAAYELHQKIKLTSKTILLSIGSFLIPVLPWYGYNTLNYGWKFLGKNVFEIGLRKGSVQGVSLTSIKKTLLYLHAAVHRWYKPFLASLLTSGVIIWFKRQQKSVLRPLFWVLLYLGLVGFPYFLSAKTEIWHLIPVMAPLSLLIPLSFSYLLDIVELAKINLLFLGVVLSIAVFSLKDYWAEFININPSTSDAAVIAATNDAKQTPLFLTNDAFYPTIVYYSDLEKPIKVIKEYQFDLICENSLDPFRFITDEGFAQEKGNYEELARVGDLLLVEFSNHTCFLEN